MTLSLSNPMRMALVTLVTVLLMWSVGGLATGAAAAAPSVWVDDDGRVGPNGCGGAMRTHSAIQHALDAASASRPTTILVCPGTYPGNLRIEGDGVTLRATRPWNVKVVAEADPSADAVVDITGDDVTVQWLNIVVPTTRTGSTCDIDLQGIQVDSTLRTTIRGNQIRGRRGPHSRECGLSDGIAMYEANGTISHNQIRDFRHRGIYADVSGVDIRRNSIRFWHPDAERPASGASSGIQISGSLADIVGNAILGQWSGRPGPGALTVGIRASGGPEENSVRIRGNRVVRTGSAAVELADVSDASTRARWVVADNHLRHGRGVGIQIADGSDIRVRRNLVHEFVGAGVRISAGVNDVIRDNDFRGNDLDGILDCVDVTTGSGTSGTANQWTHNLGHGSSPTGICASPR